MARKKKVTDLYRYPERVKTRPDEELPGRGHRRDEAGEQEPQLTGFIRGEEAGSAAEELFSIALSQHETRPLWEYKRSFIKPRGMFGSVEVDFLVDIGGTVPVFIDSEFTHLRDSAQKAEDVFKQMTLDKHLAPRGYRPSIRILMPSHPRLEDAELAVEKLLNGAQGDIKV